MNKETIKSQLIEKGCVGNAFLVSKEEIPERKCMELRYKKDHLEFISLPNEPENIYLRMNRDGPDVITADLGLQAVFRNIVRIERPQIGKKYDLSQSTKEPHHLMKEGTYTLYNSVNTPNRFNLIKGYDIEVLLMKDGYLRVDLLMSREINDDLDKVCFARSKEHKKAWDIVPSKESGNQNEVQYVVPTGTLVYEPMLVEYLIKDHALIGPAKVNHNTYYGWIPYRKTKRGKRFVDVLKHRGISNIEYNLMMIDPENGAKDFCRLVGNGSEKIVRKRGLYERR